MWAIIVAAGSGTRMNSEIPKQFLELCGKPIVIRSIIAFADACDGIHPVVVLPPLQIGEWHKLCDKYNFRLPHKIVEGGFTRFQSVKNGLALIPDEGMVAIHDGVRPLVSRQTIINCFRESSIYGCAIPTIPVNDSVREISDHSSRILERSKLRLIQTPQVFDVAKLKKAYQQEYSPEFTDDASVFEADGNTIRLIEGNVENIKITTPNDLLVAETLFQGVL